MNSRRVNKYKILIFIIIISIVWGTISVSAQTIDPKVYAGRKYTVILKNDGTVWGVGNNDQGNLGQNSSDDVITKYGIALDENGDFIQGVIDIGTGTEITALLLSDGTILVAGDDEHGAFNDGSYGALDDVAYFVDGSFSDVQAIEGGNDYLTALKNDGTVWSVGFNLGGQIGVGDNTIKTTYTQAKIDASNLLTNIVAISANGNASGDDRTVALRNDGTVWSAGDNTSGEIGIGSSGNSQSYFNQAQVSPGGAYLTSVTAIDTGLDHTVALKEDGTVWTVGYYYTGQLGLGISGFSAFSSPRTYYDQAKINSSTYLTSVTAIAAGGSHTLALREDGTVWSVGFSDYVGDNSLGSNQSYFIQSKDSSGSYFTNVIGVAAGHLHAAVLKSDGTVEVIGSNKLGQLGTGYADAGGAYDTDSYVVSNINAINAFPTASDKTISIDEDNAYTLTESDFGYSDTDSTTMDAIMITALETDGALTLSGTAVSLNDEISREAIVAGELVFTPDANENGATYATFDFKVSDTYLWSETADTMTMSVAAINDTPTAVASSVTFNEDTTYTFTESDFNYSDNDLDVLDHITVVTTNGIGTFNISGAAVLANDEISKAAIDAGLLVFTPAADAYGNGYAEFYYKVNDGTVDSDAAYKMTINVSPVSNSSGSSNKTKDKDFEITIDEDIFVAEGTMKKTWDDGQYVAEIDIKSIEEYEQTDYEDEAKMQIDYNASKLSLSIDGDIAQEMVEKNIVSELKDIERTYIVETNKINVQGFAEALEAESEDRIEIVLDIIEEQGTTEKVLEGKGLKVLVDNFTFSITGEYAGKTVKVDEINQFVPVLIEIISEEEQNELTTAVRLDDEGNYVHVPTKIVEIDGKKYAKISSLYNGQYSLVKYKSTYTDIAEHWAEEEIIEMTEKLIIESEEDNQYKPSNTMTKMDFVAKVAKALGLRSNEESEVIDEQLLANRGAEYIGAAYNKGLLVVSEEQRVTEEITREEAMTIIIRAMEIAEHKIEIEKTKQAEMISVYSDADSVGKWAYEYVSKCIKVGLIIGRNEDTIAAKDTLTRAECAALIDRFLEVADLSN